MIMFEKFLHMFLSASRWNFPWILSFIYSMTTTSMALHASIISWVKIGVWGGFSLYREESRCRQDPGRCAKTLKKVCNPDYLFAVRVMTESEIYWCHFHINIVMVWLRLMCIMGGGGQHGPHYCDTCLLRSQALDFHLLIQTKQDASSHSGGRSL